MLGIDPGMLCLCGTALSLTYKPLDNANNGAPEICFHFDMLYECFNGQWINSMYYWISFLAYCEEEPSEDKERSKASDKLTKIFMG